MKNKLKCIATGLLSGLPNGFFGAGGGMILVPLFCRWIKLPEREAFATSVSVILPMSIVSAVIYLMRADFKFIEALPYLLGGLVGGVIAGFVFKKVPTGLLRKALGIFIIYGGVRSLFF